MGDIWYIYIIYNCGQIWNGILSRVVNEGCSVILSVDSVYKLSNTNVCQNAKVRNNMFLYVGQEPWIIHESYVDH